jgi:hypothetical protein
MNSRQYSLARPLPHIHVLRGTCASCASSLPHLAIIYLLPVLLLCACDLTSDKPYLTFAGGGFIFNYRLATAEYGFVARVMRPIPEHSIVEAQFDNPAGGSPIVLRQKTAPGRSSYVFQTPPLQGVAANHDYRVVLRLLNSEGDEFARYEKSFHSEVDQSVLPDSPPVVGPGYQPAPTSQ